MYVINAVDFRIITTFKRLDPMVRRGFVVLLDFWLEILETN